MDLKREEELKKIVKDNYQAIAEDFSASRDGGMWPEIQDLLDSVPAGAKVLDLGCGSGRLLLGLKEKNLDYLGIDNSQEMLAQAKARHPENKFQVDDLETLDSLPSDYFDYVFCLAAWHYLPGSARRLKSLKRMKELLNSEGRLVISVWNLWDGKNRQAGKVKTIFSWLISFFSGTPLDFGDRIFSWKSAAAYGSRRYYHAFRENELKRLARSAGFSSPEIKKDPYNYWLFLKKS